MKRSPVMMMCDPPPAMGDDGGQLVFQGAELECIIPLAGAGMVRLGGDQVAARDQLVAADGGIVVDGPLIIFENLGGVLDTNRKMASSWRPGWCCRARRTMTLATLRHASDGGRS
jgi:hypothetical protein